VIPVKTIKNNKITKPSPSHGIFYTAHNFSQTVPDEIDGAQGQSNIASIPENMHRPLNFRSCLQLFNIHHNQHQHGNISQHKTKMDEPGHKKRVILFFFTFRITFLREEMPELV
jgi:hypothetical protein